MIMAFDFQAIRREHPIADVIGREVKLKRAGRNRIGCCPFHPDRTPSFVVYEDSFHCFGCGAGGDVIDYTAKMEGLRTAEAIAFLTGGSVPELTDEDRQRLRRDRETAERQRRANEEAAILEARKRWQTATPNNGAGHPYLERKQIAAYGARVEGSSLLLPILDREGAVQSVQAIPAEPGEKKLFHAGASVRSGRFIIGAKDGGPICIVEGFATGATVHAATDHMVVVAFSKSNISTVAEDIRQDNRGRRIIIAADLDAEILAHDVAEKIGGLVVVPQLEGADGSDFNDQATHYGLEDVARTFAAKLDNAPTALPLIWYKNVAPTLNGNWIVKNVLPSEAFATIIGHPGCGKSFAGLDLALHIASGQEWQGRKVKPGLVIYLAAEGQRGQQNRVEAWRRHHGIEDLDNFALIPVAINLRDKAADLPKLISTIHAAIEQSGQSLSVLFVDTLNRTFGGGDENGPEMTDYVNNVGALKAEFGCTAVVIHHIPKNAENITERGHGSLRGAIETSLVVKADPETGLRTLHCSKQKDGEDGWTIQFKLEQLELGEDEDGDKVTSCVVIADEGDILARTRGPHLSPTQRSIYNELLATLEAAPVGIPRDIPDDVIERERVGKVVATAAWRERWLAIGATDMAPGNASRTFRRGLTELKNKGLIGVWNDHSWATHR